MIVTRGGGSLEDLWPFNEEAVARAIYDSDIPVISAVGHEVDYTIADFAADFRAPTPSAAAELVIPRKEDLVNLINTSTTRLKNALAGKMNILKEKITKLRESYVLKRPLNLITQYEQKIDDLRKEIAAGIDRILGDGEESFNLLAGKLGALSPLAILTRGYSITTRLPEGVIVKDAGDLKAGDRVETRLGKGSFTSRVEGEEKCPR
jgi:exodeoxyribonuclease VII large subunit